MAELLGDDEIKAGLGQLSWQRQGDALVKTVKRRDFAGSMEFVNRVAELAEGAGHHPDIAISWDTVQLSLSTHSAGGITSADLDLARRIDEVG